VVLGGSGLVGSRWLALTASRFRNIAPSHAELDVLNRPALAAFLAAARAEAEVVLNGVAWADVDGAERQRDDLEGSAYRLNAAYVRDLAELCSELGLHLLHLSTDYVFDGALEARPYREDDPPNPLSWYARTKRQGELFALGAGAQVTVARLEMPFTAQPHAKLDFARLCASRLRAGGTIAGVVDQKITPVFLDDAVLALAELVERRPSGVLHVAASDWTTPYQYARLVARQLGLDEARVQPVDFQAFAATRPAPRPRHTGLDVSALERQVAPGLLRPVEQAVSVWAHQLAAQA
jgi:dTDP-4-dehydrorhamnose reductase